MVDSRNCIKDDSNKRSSQSHSKRTTYDFYLEGNGVNKRWTTNNAKKNKNAVDT